VVGREAKRDGRWPVDGVIPMPEMPMPRGMDGMAAMLIGNVLSGAWNDDDDDEEEEEEVVVVMVVGTADADGSRPPIPSAAA
jgi:hypothetical protein